MALHRIARTGLLLAVSATALAGCADFDIDLRTNDANTSEAARTVTAPRPEPDARGLISYPGYQVAVARRGDTVADVATRLGLGTEELARHNGLSADIALRQGEILALPRRVETGSGVDIATLAGDAINRADGQITPADPASSQGPEPIRHQVLRGETAYSIARLYNVSVRALADWNGLGPELTVREGQYLLIPVIIDSSPAALVTTTLPGQTSGVETPPSAAQPLPEDETPEVSETPASPDLSQDRSTSARLSLPVEGNIIREFEKKKNEGIDISAAAGTAVHAAAAGTVAAITRDTDQVPILVLRHEGDLLTVYANIDAIAVEKGDTVSRGQTIAKVRAGNPAFVHFEVREGFESVDPLPYLN